MMFINLSMMLFLITNNLNYKPKNKTMKKQKRKRIHKIYGTPIFNTSVEYRIKQVLNQLMSVQPTLKTA